MQGTPRPRREKLKRRRVSSIREFATRRDLERFVPLYGFRIRGYDGRRTATSEGDEGLPLLVRKTEE